MFVIIAVRCGASEEEQKRSHPVETRGVVQFVSALDAQNHADRLNGERRGSDPVSYRVAPLSFIS